MRLALVTHGLPQPSSNGGPMTCWAIVNALLAAGHRVGVASLLYPGDSFDTPERRTRLLDLGVDLVQVEVEGAERLRPDSLPWLPRAVQRVMGVLRFDSAEVFPTLGVAPKMKVVLEKIKPDAMFIYHWDSLASVHGIKLAPQLAGVGDPWHLPNLRRWQQAMPTPAPSYLLWTLRTLRDLMLCPGLMVRMLNQCEMSGCFQAHAAAWLRRKGAAHCVYLRSPLVDPSGGRWRELRNAMRSVGRPRILLGPSNLEATSTSAGIRLFAREILPRLEREFGPDGFEVHIVGEGQPPREVAAMLARPAVKLRGRVEPADQEFLSADIQLVPTPFVLGIRLRIITGFAFGTCIVAHRSDAVNIPEMVHESNSLLASDGAGLAVQVIRAIRDVGLREQLSVAARRTYERFFSPEAAATPIVSSLERLAASRQRNNDSPAKGRRY